VSEKQSRDDQEEPEGEVDFEHGGGRHTADSWEWREVIAREINRRLVRHVRLPGIARMCK